jgi:hypothetical protein
MADKGSADVQRREVSESIFEYLLGEMLNLDPPTGANDQLTATAERLEAIGYDIGYRYHLEIDSL